MNIECIVALPDSENGSYRKSLNNFKKQWAKLCMEKRDDGYLDAVLMYISAGQGIVKLNHGILLSLPFEYICLKE